MGSSCSLYLDCYCYIYTNLIADALLHECFVDLVAPDTRVFYRNPALFEKPSFTINFVNETGHRLDICISAYGWYPNGSILAINSRCGRGSIDIDYEGVREYAVEWRRYIEGLGNDVEAIKPGIIVL